MSIPNLHIIPTVGDGFVGIRIVENRIEFHHPETYVLSKDDLGLRQDILTILRTVSLAKTMTKETTSYNSRHEDSEEFPLGAYLWIITIT